MIFGPDPKNYEMDLPKKMKHKAIRSGLSTRYSEDNLAVVETLKFDEPKTKKGLAILDEFDLGRDTLIIVSQEEDDWKIAKSFSNIPEALYITTSQINAYEILNHRGILLTRDAIGELEETLLEKSKVT